MGLYRLSSLMPGLNHQRLLIRPIVIVSERERACFSYSDMQLSREPLLTYKEKETARDGDKVWCWYERSKIQLADQSAPRVMHAGNMALYSSVCHALASPRLNGRNKAFSPHTLSLNRFHLFFLHLPPFPSLHSLILSLQIYPPVFSLVIKSCQAEVGLHSIIPRSSHIWCNPEESRHNTHHLLSAKYVGEFCRIFTQSHSVPFINYHITKEAHLLCMVCCLGAYSNRPL